MTIKGCLKFVVQTDSSRRQIYRHKLMRLVTNMFLAVSDTKLRGIDEKSEIIVSLTSYPGRINIVHRCIRTLLNQDLRPGKVILWLAREEFPQGESMLPSKLMKLKKYGLQIRFCDNLGPHKKYFYVMQEYPDNPIITADDDSLYPENLISGLKELADGHPGCVCCNKAAIIKLNDEGIIAPYEEWKDDNSENCQPSMKLLAVGGRGIYYPPRCLHEDVFNRKVAMEIAPFADDLWLKCMELRKGTAVVRSSEIPVDYFRILSSQKTALYKRNTVNGGNDIVIGAIRERYPEIVELLRESR